MQLRTINNAFKVRKLDIELVKGKGYFYFVGDGCENLQTTSVMVPRLNILTLGQWLEEGDSVVAKVAEHKANKAERAGEFNRFRF